MKRRLYFLLPDLGSAIQTANDLLLARIDEIQDLVSRRHPEATAHGIEPTMPAFP